MKKMSMLSFWLGGIMMISSLSLAHAQKSEITIPETATKVLSENFVKAKGQQDNPGSEITTKLDQYTELPGWLGSKVYESAGSLKLGTGSAAGSLSTPALDLSSDNGKFYVSFQAMAWNNDSTFINVIAGNDTIKVEGLEFEENNPATSMKGFIVAFDNGTEDSKVTFEAVNSSKNRFYIDSIAVYQVLPNEPMFLGLSESLKMETIMGIETSTDLKIRGYKLTDSVEISCNSKHISLSHNKLSADTVMKAQGFSIEITFKADTVADTSLLVLKSGDVKDSVTIIAQAEDFIVVKNLAELRKGEQKKLYKVSSEVVLTAMDKYRNYKFVQDSTAGILIDDATGLVTNDYKVGNGITGIFGRLGSYNDQLQLVMVANLPEASSDSLAINPIEISIDSLENNMEEFCSRVVMIKGLSMVKDSIWKGNKDHYAVAGEDTLNLRTFISNGNYVGDSIPAKFDLIGIAGIYKGKLQVSPRVKTDIIAINDGDGDGDGNDSSVNNTWVVADLNARIYPNPCQGAFFIELDEEAQVEIFNAMGVRIQSMQLTAGQHSVNIRQSGVYFVRFNSKEGQLVRRVVVR